MGSMYLRHTGRPMGRLAIVTDGYWLVVLTDRAVEDRERAGRWQERICGWRLPWTRRPDTSPRDTGEAATFRENSDKANEDRSHADTAGDARSHCGRFVEKPVDREELA